MQENAIFLNLVDNDWEVWYNLTVDVVDCGLYPWAAIGPDFCDSKENDMANIFKFLLDGYASSGGRISPTPMYSYKSTLAEAKKDVRERFKKPKALLSPVAKT